jgi:tetrahydromethanopterin S-methyltransferase subunit H
MRVTPQPFANGARVSVELEDLPCFSIMRDEIWNESSHDDPRAAAQAAGPATVGSALGVEFTSIERVSENSLLATLKSSKFHAVLVTRYDETFKSIASRLQFLVVSKPSLRC